MQKLIIIILLSLIIYSSDTGCDGCGPFYHYNYVIDNQLNQNIRLIFKDSLIADTIEINQNTSHQFYSDYGYGAPNSTTDDLTLHLYDYDSCIFFISDTIFNKYSRNHFMNTTPPELDFLNVSDYIETKEEKCIDKFGKKNDVYCKEQEFLINNENLLKMK